MCRRILLRILEEQNSIRNRNFSFNPSHLYSILSRYFSLVMSSNFHAVSFLLSLHYCFQHSILVCFSLNICIAYYSLLHTCFMVPALLMTCIFYNVRACKHIIVTADTISAFASFIFKRWQLRQNWKHYYVEYFPVCTRYFSFLNNVNTVMLKVPTTMFAFSTITYQLQSSVVRIDYPSVCQLHRTAHDTFK